MRRDRTYVGMVCRLGAVILVAGLSLFCPRLGARERTPEPTEAPAGQTEAVVTNLVQARQWTRALAETNLMMRVEGVVQGVFPQMAQIVLWDGTAAAGVRLDLERFPLKPGQRIRIEGHGRFGNGLISLTPPLLVDNDGLHGEQEASARIWLSQGVHPFQVNYFQRAFSAVLRMTWERPGQKAESLPAEALVHLVRSSNGGEQYVKGLAYDYFEGAWGELPDFDRLKRIKTGVQADVSLPPVVREMEFALRMKGFLRVPESGVYVFHLISDDGSQVFVQDKEVQVTVISENQPLERDNARPLGIGQALSKDEEYRWVTVQGTITFSSRRIGSWDVEIGSESGRMRLLINDSANLPLELLRNHQVRVVGLCQQAFDTGGNQVVGALLVPGLQEIVPLETDGKQWQSYPLTVIGRLSEGRMAGDEGIVHLRGAVLPSDLGQTMLLEDETARVPVRFWGLPPKKGSRVEILGRCVRQPSGVLIEGGLYRAAGGDETVSAEGLPVLTSAKEVRQLKADEAARGYPVRLRGVITDRHSLTQGVIQDSTSGVYLEFDAPTPRLPVGSFCELKGVTAPGGFAPIVKVSGATNLGAGQFPAPLRLDYAQLVEGSMDCQWVEIEGLVSEVGPFGDLRISIKGGQVGVTIIDSSNPEIISGLSNAFVRVRGCAIPKWNDARQVVGAALIRVPSISFITVDQRAPDDAFDSPVKRIAELSQFHPRMDGFRPAVVHGQVTHVAEGVVYLTDGTNGLRCLPKARPVVVPGDLVEVAGLPELDGPSPLLQEGLVRKTGHAELPEPTRLEMAQIAQGRSDAAWVQIQARLISSRPSHTGLILELESDMRGIEAYCRTNVSPAAMPAPGSQLAVSGVVARRERSKGGNSDSFILLVASPKDIVCLKPPPRWTLKHALALITVMTVLIVLAGLWITLLRRTVEQRTQAVRVEMEERRSAEARLRALEMRNALETQRARIARNIHDDLGARATKLTRLADMIQTRGADAAHCLKDISITSRQMVEALDETVWAVNPANDSLARLADYVTHFVDEFFHGTEASCQLDIPLDLPDRSVSAEFRYSLLLLVKEALNNALKYSHARNIILKMALVENQLRVTIQDDGNGFDPGLVPMGNGLASMKARAAGLGGKLELETEPGQGTTVRVMVPVPDGIADSDT